MIQGGKTGMQLHSDANPAGHHNMYFWAAMNDFILAFLNKIVKSIIVLFEGSFPNHVMHNIQLIVNAC